MCFPRQPWRRPVSGCGVGILFALANIFRLALVPPLSVASTPREHSDGQPGDCHARHPIDSADALAPATDAT